MNGMPWCTEPFNFDGIHHDLIAVPDTLRVQDTISFLVISELGVIGMLRLQTGQHPVGSSQPSVHHPRRDDIQPLPPRYRAYPNTIQRYLLLSAPQNKVLTFICFAHKHSLPPAVRYTSAGKHQHRAGHL